MSEARADRSERRKITPEEVEKELIRYGIQFQDCLASTYVYFITDGEYVKIGKGYPSQRINQMQTANARELTTLFSVPVGHGQGNRAETVIHHLFRDYLVRGEWYDLTDVIDADAFRERFGCEG